MYNSDNSTGQISNMPKAQDPIGPHKVKTNNGELVHDSAVNNRSDNNIKVSACRSTSHVLYNWSSVITVSSSEDEV